MAGGLPPPCRLALEGPGTGPLCTSGREEVQHLEFPRTTWGTLRNHNTALNQAQKNKLLPKTELETSRAGPDPELGTTKPVLDLRREDQK